MSTAEQPRRSGPTWPWVLVLVAAIVGGAWYWVWHTGQRAAAPKPNVVTLPACTAAELKVSKGSSQGAAGTIYTHLVFTNMSDHTCQLTGYPAVFLTDASAAILDTGAGPNAQYPMGEVQINGGAQAHVVLGVPQAANFDKGMCSDVSTGLQLYLPAQTTPLKLPWADANCPGFSVSSFQSGA